MKQFIEIYALHSSDRQREERILSFNYKDGSKTITLAKVEGSDLSVFGALSLSKFKVY